MRLSTRHLGSWPLVSGRWGVADWNYRQMWTHILKSDCHTLPQPGCPQDNRSSFIEDDGSPPPVAASHYFLRVGQWRQASLPRTFGNFGQSSVEVLLHTIRCLWICNPWALHLRWGTKLFSWWLDRVDSEAHCTHLRVTCPADLGSLSETVSDFQNSVKG